MVVQIELLRPEQGELHREWPLIQQRGIDSSRFRMLCICSVGLRVVAAVERGVALIAPTRPMPNPRKRRAPDGGGPATAAASSSSSTAAASSIAAAASSSAGADPGAHLPPPLSLDWALQALQPAVGDGSASGGAASADAATREARLLTSLVAALPQLDVAALTSRLDSIGADIAETRRFASEGAAASTEAAVARLRAQVEAKDGLIAALRAQVAGLQARVTAEGPIPAACVLRSETYKAALAEQGALSASVSHMQTQLLGQSSLAQSQRDALQALLSAQVAAATSRGA